MNNTPYYKIQRNPTLIFNTTNIKKDNTSKFISCLKQDDTYSSNKATLQKLLKSIQETERGLTTSRTQKLAIEKLVDEIATNSSTLITTDEIQTGTWKLLYTTEKVSCLMIMCN